MNTLFVRGWAVLLIGSSSCSSHVTDGLGCFNVGGGFVSSLFERLIVALSRLFIVGTLEGWCDGDEMGFSDGFLFVDRSFIYVCFM